MKNTTWLITAGRGDEQTIAVDSLGGSVFTHAVLKGLRGSADTRNALGADGLVTVGELKEYISQEVGRLRIGFNWQKTITPQIRDLSGSDGAFFFPVAASFPDGTDTTEGDGTVVPQGGDADLIEVQRSLISLGYDPGPPDGLLSFATRRALAAFQSERDLPLTGVADEATVLALVLAMNQPSEDPSPEEPSVDPILGDPIAGDPEPRAEAPCADCPEMIAVPGGRFTLGRDDGKPEQGPAREAEVAPFQIARTETTMGLFRRYIEEYLRSHPKVRQDRTLIVRQLEPGAQGIPLEVYCFSSDIVWANYEGIQSDIFDHFLAIAPEFGLRVFQSPSGADLARLGESSERSAAGAPA